MKAYVTIQNFGSDDQKRDLCDSIENATLGQYPATLAESGNVVVVCDVKQLGELFARLAENTATNWIEYTIQFDA